MLEPFSEPYTFQLHPPPSCCHIVNSEKGGLFNTFFCAPFKISKYRRTCVPRKCYGVLGGVYRRSLYIRATQVLQKLRHNFPHGRTPESNVSNNYLLEQKYWPVSSRFQFSFCPLMEFLFIVGSERSATIKLAQVWPKVTWGSPITPQYLKPSKQIVQKNPESFTTFSAIGLKKKTEYL